MKPKNFPGRRQARRNSAILRFEKQAAEKRIAALEDPLWSNSLTAAAIADEKTASNTKAAVSRGGSRDTRTKKRRGE